MKMSYESIYEASLGDPEGFWEEQAKAIEWFAFPRKIRSQNKEGLCRWFEGGKLNTCFLAVDRHIDEGRGDQVAIYFDSPVTNTKESFTYLRLRDEVARLAGALKKLGVSKGDRVIIYMPMIPQTLFAMLACARIGAIHSVVFGGFASHELSKRIDDAEPKLILTASCGIEVNRVIPYKPFIDEALLESRHQVDSVVIYQRQESLAEIIEGRDYDWEELVASAQAVNCEWLDATDPLYVIYTSGTTGRPKGVVRDNGGHAVAMDFSMRTVYGANPGDVFWAASDVGWIVGHSYIVYGPLIRGCTTIVYEGKPVRTPDAGAFWRVIEEYKVNQFFTAPTAFRAIVKEDPEGALLKGYDVSSLKRQYLAGERCDVATLEWAQKHLKVPVIDHWWQTESGWPMLANMAGVELLPVKPGSACKPVCGYDMKVVDERGRELPAGKEGALVIRYPLPPGTLLDLWKDTKRFKESYLSQFPGYYFTGDGAYRDDEGYFFITGRIDDVINVAGHRLSTATLEEVVSKHADVAECAVIGVDDVLKGQIPVGIVILKQGVKKDPKELERELIQAVRKAFGAVASFKNVLIARRLPKTRSGKILRSSLRAIADGKPLPSVATIDDPTSLGEIEALFDSLGEKSA